MGIPSNCKHNFGLACVAKLNWRLVRHICNQMSQLLVIVTQTNGNKAVTNIIYSMVWGRRSFYCDRRSAEYFWSRLLMVDICAGILFLLIFTTYDSARGMTSTIQKRLNKLPEIWKIMILDKGKHSNMVKLIATRINNGYNNACCYGSGCGSWAKPAIEMHVPLTSSQVLESSIQLFFWFAS